jgi:hypothetical protein
LSEIRKFIHNLTVCVLLASFAVHPGFSAQTHVVSPGDLQKELVGASRARQHNQDTIGAFLSSPKAQKALRAAGVDLKQVTAAVSGLNDEELARLAARADKAQEDLAAGRITDRELLFILVGIAVVILIIVAVD